jgi:hypothetical protein
MSIYGIGNSGINRTTTQLPVRDNTRTQQQGIATRVQPGQLAPHAPAAPKGAVAAVPSEPPPGTDPALWSILSSEERGFFAKAGAMGPLTYGRAFSDMKSAQMPANRGGRLDIKI